MWYMTAIASGRLLAEEALPQYRMHRGVCAKQEIKELYMYMNEESTNEYKHTHLHL